MLVKLGKVFVVFALVATLGAHWALLQTIAWTTMLAGNLQSGSFSCAIAKTFDGEHPCCLCKAIAAAKKSQQRQELNVQNSKLDFTATQDNLVLIAPSPVEPVPFTDSFAKSSFQKPPTPPPRTFFI